MTDLVRFRTGGIGMAGWPQVPYQQWTGRLESEPLILRASENPNWNDYFTRVEALSRQQPVVGWLAYELGPVLDPALGAYPVPVGTPLAFFSPITDIRVENLDATTSGGEREVIQLWRAIGHELLQSTITCQFMDRATYLQSIERLQDGMSAGDWYEANLSARLAVQSRRLPMELAADLFQVLDPSCGAALMTEHQVVISASPELFVRRSGNHLVTRPIKGSAPRHGQKEADLQQLQGLLSCPKNAAEHLMVVDLARNDLGRICRPGSVRVVDYKLGETHAAVHHLVSTIEGEMPESLSLAPILQALWPPASITGCPKVAVTKALAREETSPRGLYTGAFGVLWPGGDFQFNVAIRTLWSDAPEPDGSRIWTLGSGGAIVADSSPEMEWEEFLFKALPIVGALVDPSARHHLPASFSYEPF